MFGKRFEGDSATMLTTNCEGMTRRNALRIGLGGWLGLGAASTLGLSNLRALRAANAAPGSGKPSPSTSCIVIWLDGGPTHYETFDPKPDAPREIRGEFGTVATTTPGVHFSEQMVRLARLFPKFSVIRSIRHDQGNHGAGNHYMMTGAPTRIPVGCGAFVSFHPSLGSVAAYERGNPDGLPAYFTLPSMTRSGGPSFLGAKYAPFAVPDNPDRDGFHVRDVALPRRVDGDRFERREALRQRVDRLERTNDRAAADPVAVWDQYGRDGRELVSSREAQAAFDIAREPLGVRDAYGRNSFGQRALLARRLVEAGVPFVTINEGGWDHHTNLFPALRQRLPTFDRTIATLIDDLDQRGLLDTTMVLVLGEFGRTPQINKDGGRDHWSNAMSVLFAGCGTPGGQAIGATDPKGFSAVDSVYGPEAFVASVYTKLGIDPGKIYYTPEGRPVHLVADARVIPELFDRSVDLAT
jgi:hypothetical protein